MVFLMLKPEEKSKWSDSIYAQILDSLVLWSSGSKNYGWVGSTRTSNSQERKENQEITMNIENHRMDLGHLLEKKRSLTDLCFTALKIKEIFSLHKTLQKNCLRLSIIIKINFSQMHYSMLGETKIRYLCRLILRGRMDFQEIMHTMRILISLIWESQQIKITV